MEIEFLYFKNCPNYIEVRRNLIEAARKLGLTTFIKDIDEINRTRNVLFLCTQNSCRSQMAEGFARKLLDERFEIFSAGTIPSSVNPRAIKVMKEIGIDISNHYSKSVEILLHLPFEYVITVCDRARESCPNFTGVVKNRLHWNFEDPAEVSGTEEIVMRIFRKVRDLIKNRVSNFVSSNL
ncbi:arsenate reductase ArsC [candidate division KSB1 bacterium]|nr:MAG: arsenate reductase ArsC [candidate division KSB1 bacterium]